MGGTSPMIPLELVISQLLEVTSLLMTWEELLCTGLVNSGSQGKEVLVIYLIHSWSKGDALLIP